MRPLPALERFFERIFERPTARLFRTRLQPVQVQRRIERAMESERLSGADRTLVPNRFRVHMHPEDLAGFGEMAATLATELADGALAFARSHRYAVADRPRVDLIADRTTVRGEVRVHARFVDPEPAPRVSVDDGQPNDADEVDHGNQTRVFQVPVIEGPLARLREVRPDGTQRTVEIDGTTLTIGRGSDNDLVLWDGRVSRHHGRLHSRRGALVYTDMGSTNGSRVNGVSVGEVVLGEGDQIELGDTILVVESLSA